LKPNTRATWGAWTQRGRLDRASTVAYVRTRLAISVALLLLPSACAVGPAYEKPAPPAVSGYTATPMPGAIAGAPDAPGNAAAEQALQYGAAVGAKWYANFGSPALTRLVEQGLAHNPDLSAAQATLVEAQYNLRALNGIFYPQISAGLDAARERISGATTGGPPRLFNLYTGQVNVTYYPDVFGLNRLVAAGGQAQVDVARDQLSAARLTINGNVVNAAINIAGLDAQIDAINTSIADLQAIVDLTRKRYELGAESRLALLAQEGQLATTQARLPALVQARDQTLHLLATYLGQFPSQASGIEIPVLGDLRLPETLPVSLPSTLVRDRPDIRAAEAQLRAANALVGERVAAMYPRLQLTGNYGGQSVRGDLFNPAYRIWTLAASVAAPLFQGGTLEAQKNAARAAYDAVFAMYQRTVLGAFRNVADALRALEHDATLLDANARAMASAQQAFAIAKEQYQAGAINYLNLLTSEVQYENARIAFVQAQVQRYADTAALYVALGGGEWQEAAQREATPVNAEGGR
jgi:NodT family efflux transporter outer membrane factor (OMF) lipoprotein